MFPSTRSFFRAARSEREAGVLRFERDGWHTTAKAREFFK